MKALESWKNVKHFHSLPAGEQNLLFYAENSSAWAHFEPIIAGLIEEKGAKIYYATSCHSDPVLKIKNTHLLPFYIGMGMPRTYFFSLLRTKIVVMTMPDLNSFYIKRSMVHPVHYVYVFHSMVSTHMIYRSEAFDHFDTVFCVGPHHVKEIRTTEARYQRKKKTLVEHGYGRLDTIWRESLHSPIVNYRKKEKEILIAPSYGPNGLLETCGVEVVKRLSDAGYRVTVRPHPVTLKTHPKIIRKIQILGESKKNIFLDLDMTSRESLLRSDLMISDWSGAALEYAFCLERPVLFIDVPRKINNPLYESLLITPLEVSIREIIGKVLSTENLDLLPKTVDSLCSDAQKMAEQIRKCREETVFNLGNSGKVGANFLWDLVSQKDSDTRAIDRQLTKSA